MRYVSLYRNRQSIGRGWLLAGSQKVTVHGGSSVDFSAGYPHCEIRGFVLGYEKIQS